MSVTTLAARTASAALLLVSASHAQDPPPVAAPLAGAVGWHADLGAATRAAAESGRPVLLFQALGRLDAHVC